MKNDAYQTSKQIASKTVKKLLNDLTSSKR
jgi:hypothetical protein